VPPDHKKEAGGESSKGLFLERMIQVANTGMAGGVGFVGAAVVISVISLAAIEKIQ
jgi:hypothetical protein